MTNILITGIQGFVGSHLAYHLSEDSDTNIIGLSRSLKHNTTFEALELDKRKNISVVCGDVRNRAIIEEILVQYDIDNVYHLAAKAIVKDAVASPSAVYQTNIFGTVNLLEALRGRDKRINVLIMTSDKSYGKGELPYKEDSLLNGLDIYSSSKACEDIIGRTYANEYGMNIVVARSANVFGEFDFNWSRIIPQFIKAYMSNGKIVINKTTSNHVREYIYVKDEVSALKFLMDNIINSAGSAYNIGSGDVYNVDTLVEIFKEVSGFTDVEYVEKEKGFKEIENQYLDCTKIGRLGWKKKYDFKAALVTTVYQYANLGVKL